MTSSSRTLAALVGSATVVLSLVCAPVAQAANVDTVRSNVPKPAVCKNKGTLPQGAWLANKGCGYVVGTALAGSQFDNNINEGHDYHFGRSHQSGGANLCAWILPGSLSSTGRNVADNCSRATADRISHRRAIGRDFDSAPHEGNGAAKVAIDASRCAGYYNYSTDSTYKTGRLHDPVGHALVTAGGYRYTTLDGKAALIRNGTGDATTWMFVARSCIASQLEGHTLSNADD